MLIESQHVTLFHYAEGDAEVLRPCHRNRGFKGVIDSNQLFSYNVFTRESDGKIRKKKLVCRKYDYV